jgi:hypothetical protein
MSWFHKKPEWELAEALEVIFKDLKKRDILTANDISLSIEKLHLQVVRIKISGVSIWNAKEVLPKIFDVVEGSFVIMKELVDKLAEFETRLDILEKLKKE